MGIELINIYNILILILILLLLLLQVLSALYNGNVLIWDYSTNTLVKSFELCEVPVRCSKFITRKQWFIAGTDDMYLRVYNYNTMVIFYSILSIYVFIIY
jgi:WD40 repeat protein